jgi:transposase
MLNASAARIYLCLDPTDMRKSFDTLAALVRAHLQGDPQSGTWFVFRGKQGNRLKILYWDGDGYALWQKRLEQGTFEFPKVIGDAAGVSITATELSLILGGVALSAKRRPRYVKPADSSATSGISSYL